MKIGIMQPYLFPYIGYFQLIQSVDCFVIYNNVQFIKGGWINRNRVLVNKKPHLFTFSLENSSINSNIEETFFSEKFYRDQLKLVKTLEINYRKAPFYSDTVDLLKEIFEFTNKNVSSYIINSLYLLCRYIGINKSFLLSSNVIPSTDKKGAERVIEIVKELGGTHYINSVGGRELYSKDKFHEHGICLSFLKAKSVEYDQWGHGFVPNLSILDVLMFNSPSEIKKLLNEYELV